MTQETINALIIATPPTILAFSSFITSYRSLQVSKNNSVKTDEIHVLVNSGMDKVKDELKTSVSKVDTLEETISTLVQQLATKKESDAK